MRKIRIHKDITVHWRIKTNGQATSLVGRNISVLLTDPFGGLEKMNIAITDTNLVSFVWRGAIQKYIGEYILSAYENAGQDGATAVDVVDFVELVDRTNKEGGSDVEGLDTETVSLSSDLLSTARGLSAYEVAVANGFVGTETEWLASLKAPNLKLQYSVDGTGSWHDTPTSADYYLRSSADNGTTWSSAVLFRGSDASVTKEAVEAVLTGNITTHTHNQYAESEDLAEVATSGDYDDLENKPSIPTKTSDLTNDSGFITEHQSLAAYRTSVAQDVIDTALSGRVTTIEDKEAGWDAKYNKPSGGIPSTDMSSAVQTSLGKADSALQEHQSLAEYRKASAQDVIDLGLGNRIGAIEDVVPSEATSSNKLADKSFVNSSIAANTAYFKGTLDATTDLGLTKPASHADIVTALNAHTFSPAPTNNDYCFVVNSDEDSDVIFDRFKYVDGASATWSYEYSLNNSSFTAAQWSAINSGITSGKVGNYDAHLASTSNPHSVTKAQVGLGNVPNTDFTQRVEALEGKTKLSDFTDDLGSSPTHTHSQYLTEHQSLADYSTTQQMNASISAHHDSTKQDVIDSAHKLSYTLLSDTPSIPSKTSELTNDSGFLTSHQSLDAYRTSVAQDVIDATKASTADLESGTLVPALAKNIKGLQADNTAKFIRRTTAGSVDVEAGVSELDEIKGNSIVWNQLVDENISSVTIPSGHKYLFRNSSLSTTSIITSDGGAISVVGGSDVVIDLTQMFGAGNEPSTVAEFEALYGKSYYPYNEGQVLHNTVANFVTNGFNQMDSNGHFIAVNQPYQIVGTYTSITQDGETITPDANGIFTPSRGQVTVIGYDGTTCVHLVHSGDRNGQYEPHWESRLPLNLTTIKGKLNGTGNSITIFPEGLCGVGSAYDSIITNENGLATGAWKRFGKVNMGSLNWNNEGGSATFFTEITDAKAGVSDMQHIICSMYSVSRYGSYSQCDDFGDMTMAFGIEQKILYVANTSYSFGEEFKDGMQGVYLYYELATPEYYVLDEPFETYAKVDDYGMEWVEPIEDNQGNPTTAPFSATIKYGINVKDTIKNLPHNYRTKEAQDVIDAGKEAQLIAGSGITLSAPDASGRRTISADEQDMETVVITITCEDASVSTAGVTVTKTEDGTSTSYTSDAQGQVQFKVKRGHQYTVSYGALGEWNPPTTTTYTASMPQRNITALYHELSATCWGVLINQSLSEPCVNLIGDRSLWTTWQNKIGRYLLKTDGTAKKLKADDSTKYVDGTDIDETEGSVMVRIPQFYYKVKDNGNGTCTLWGSETEFSGAYLVPEQWIGAYLGAVVSGTLVSRSGINPTRNHTINNFFNYAQVNGSDYGLTNYLHRQIMMMLFMWKYGTTNSQDPSCMGYSMTGSSSNWTTEVQNELTGRTTTLGDDCGGVAFTATGTLASHISLYGIEDPFGWFWEMIQGVYFGSGNNAEQNGTEIFIYEGNRMPTNAELTTHPTGTYRQLARLTTSGYPKVMPLVSRFDLFATQYGGGSSSNWYDYCYASTISQLLVFGGIAYDGSNCGLVYAASNHAWSSSNSFFGARLAYYGNVTIEE